MNGSAKNRRKLHIWLLTFLLGLLATNGFAADRPTAMSDFAVAGSYVDGGVRRLTEVTLNKIECGCVDCDNCGVGEPTPTYLYFPTHLNENGDPIAYSFEDVVEINRSTSLFLAGADEYLTLFEIDRSRLNAAVAAGGDPSKDLLTVFRVIDAPLINIANLRFWPDPGFRAINRFADGPRAMLFENTSAVNFEMLNSFVSGARFDIDGPGLFRFQNVTTDTLGGVESFIDVDHPVAKVEVVGGIMTSTGPFAAVGVCEDTFELCGPGNQFGDLNTCPGRQSCITTGIGRCEESGELCLVDETADPCSLASPTDSCVAIQVRPVVTTCASDPPGPETDPRCACDGDGCDVSDLEAMNMICLNPDGSAREDAPPGCPLDPCGCNAHYVRQREGMVELHSTAMIGIRGSADVRIDSPAPSASHILSGVRSEGTKCSTGHSSKLVWVPPTDEAVDIAMVGNFGGWIHNIDLCGLETVNDQVGSSHYLDYNATGTVWMVGNVGAGGVVDTDGAGRIAVGAAPGATIVAAGNRVVGNTDDGGADPLDVLPVKGRCLLSQEVCDPLDPSECPQTSDACVGPEIIGVGNSWSSGQFCKWCAEDPDANCPLGICDDTNVSDDRFVNGDAAFSAAPELPETIVRLPIDLPPVDARLGGMVDAVTECRDHLCEDYYPADCDLCAPGEKCTLMSVERYNACWLQGALNKGLENGKPVFIAEGSYDIDRTLHWMHSQQLGLGPDFELEVGTHAGGWIIGQNNAVTIRNIRNEPVFASEALSFAVVQGITFETADYVDETQTPQTTVDIENVPGIGRPTAHVAFHDCNFRGGRHAFGGCMESGLQCDTMMTVNGEFSNAYIGWGSGGANALRTVAYNATLTDNWIAFGHDDGNVGHGDWSVLHADISADNLDPSVVPVDFGFVGNHSNYFFHNVTSTNKVSVVEPLIPSGFESNIPVIFDHCQLNSGNLFDPVQPWVDWGQSHGPILLHTDVGEGWVRLSGNTGADKARSVLKIDSTGLSWGQNVLEADVAGEIENRSYEFEICPRQTTCQSCSVGDCDSLNSGDVSCFDPITGFPESAACGGTLFVNRCQCVGAIGQTCPLSSDTLDTCPL